MSNDWQDIYTGNEEAAKQAAEELKQKMDEKDDLFIADQFRERIRDIDINQIGYLKTLTGCEPKEIYKSWEDHCPEILWVNQPSPELNGMTPNQVIDLIENLDRMLYHLESGAGY